MKRADVLRRLEERLARGEISEKTYLEIKSRYESEPEEPEGPMTGPAEDLRHVQDHVHSIEQTIRESIEPALRNLDFSDLGKVVQTSDSAVKIVGSGEVTGPLRTQEFKSAGSGRVNGDLDAETAKVAGSCTFEGNVKAQEFHSAGSAKVAGRLQGEEIHASGALSVGGDLEGQEVHARGSLNVGGKVTAEEFHLSGGAKINGPLEAKEVFIELGGDVTVPSIHAEEIDVRRPGGFFRGRYGLYADRIEGGEVYLECTTANVVAGDEVRIGPHCRIGRVHARDLMVHESSEVRERKPPEQPPAHAGHAGHPGAPPPSTPAAPPSPPRPPSPPVP